VHIVIRQRNDEMMEKENYDDEFNMLQKVVCLNALKKGNTSCPTPSPSSWVSKNTTILLPQLVIL